MTAHRIYRTSFASVYPHYVAKAEKKGRTKAEVDEIIRWLTGYSQQELNAVLEKRADFETFFGDAPAMNPSRSLITGTICGVRIEQIEEPLMREIHDRAHACPPDRRARSSRQADRRAGQGEGDGEDFAGGVTARRLTVAVRKSSRAAPTTRPEEARHV